MATNFDDDDYIALEIEMDRVACRMRPTLSLTFFYARLLAGIASAVERRAGLIAAYFDEQLEALEFVRAYLASRREVH